MKDLAATSGQSVLLDRILVLLSIAVALWIGFYYFAERSGIVTTLDFLGEDVGEEGLDVTFWDRLPAENQFLLFGDQTRKSRSAQERALWEKYPENKVYYANYLRLLLGDYQATGSDISFDYLEKQIRRGEELDPDNAFYNYMLAAVLFKRGAEWKSNQGDKNEEWIIKDQALLDSAVVEFNKAANKPYYRRYLNELLKERVDLFPETRRLEDRLAKVVFLASIRLGDLGLIRDLFKAMPYYIENSELPEAEASQLLDEWQGFSKKAAADAWSLIDILVLNAIITMAEKKVADVYEAMGQPDAAKETRRLSNKLSKPVENWKAIRDKRSQEVKDSQEHLLRWKGGILANMLLPGLYEPVTEEMLRPGSQAERVIAEQFSLSFLLCSLVVLMIGAWILFMVCQKASDGSIPPLFLLLPWRVSLSILGCGILLPTFLYYAYTRWSGLSSFENSFWDYRLFSLELALLGITFLAALTFLPVSYIRERCQSLDVSIPKPASPIWGKLFWWGLGTLWLSCMLTRQLFGFQDYFENFLLFCAFGISLIFCGVYLRTFIKGCKSRSPHGFYYGTLARLLMPVYACAIIFIGGVCLPWLQKEESTLLQQDTLFAPNPHGFTVLEGNIVQRLQAELVEALKSERD